MGKKCWSVAAVVFWLTALVAVAQQRNTGVAKLETTRPKTFPHRIWAACDFESATPDYAWFGPTELKDLPAYAGNKTAMGIAERPFGDAAAIMTGINPVPGPKMGKVNQLYLRYKLTGATEATFQHFSLTTEDNNHIRLSGLTDGQWSEATMNFTRDARRNDGTPGVPFLEGERMDDLKIFVGQPSDSRKYELLIDDVIFFANEPDLPPEPEPFPQRVIYLAAFDTGVSDAAALAKYWPGEFEVVTNNLPAGSYWNAAGAVPHKSGTGKWIRLALKPHRRVGERTKLRFRYHLTGATKLTVQLFDVAVQDNRHVHLSDCQQGKWTTQYVNFSRDSRRNDGTQDRFAAGHTLDDLFFFVEPTDTETEVRLLIDEVALFDAAP